MIPIQIFILLLAIIGTWNITDGIFSISLYIKDIRQTWGRDHYIRVIRIIFGIVLVYMSAQMLYCYRFN